jgi:excisionase family DNA binding protein
MSERTHEPRSETRLYAISTVADRLDISEDSVRRLIARGDLTAIRIGSSVRVAAAELESFVERRREAATR